MCDCKKYQEMLSCLLDGELSGNESAEVRAHIDTCQECRMVYEAFAGISSALSEDLEKPPAHFTDSVMDKIYAQKRSALKANKHIIQRVAALAACLALMLLGVSKLQLFQGGKASDSAMATKNSEYEINAALGEEQYTAGQAENELFDTVEAPTAADTGSLLTKENVDMAGAEANEDSVGMSVSEPVVSLMGMKMAEIYSISESEDDKDTKEELILTVTDEGALNFLAELLSFGEYPEEAMPDKEPVFIIGVESATKEIYNIRLWIIDGRIWCGKVGSTTPYIAQGSFDDLLALVSES